jgi:hypothetical protein
MAENKFVSLTDNPICPVFDWLPICAAIIDEKGNVLDVNRQAQLFFGTSSQHDFLKKLQHHPIIVDTTRLLELITDIKSGEELIYNKLLLRRFDNSISYVDIQARLIPSRPEYILLLFSDATEVNQAIFSEMIDTFRNEIAQLKPYLNKPGRELLQEIVHNYTLNESIKHKPIISSDLVCKKRIKKISSIFPEFSTNELIICNFLSMRMPISKIARITGKTPNSLRVSFHRMLHKTNLSGKRELLTKLESIITDSTNESNQTPYLIHQLD